MNTRPSVTLAPTGHQVLFTHTALWGAGAIATSVQPGATVGWTGGLSPAPILHGIDAHALATAVHALAVHASEPGAWVQTGLPHEPDRALFSPRIKALPDPAAWTSLQQFREARLDALAARAAWLDLRLLSSLGQPSSWHHFKGQPRQDDAASRLEMQPRNQGSEFVGTRLRSLAAAVAARSIDMVEAGLIGATRQDEGGNDSPDSRSAANLQPPGVTDNALAWVAMWGLSTAPVAHLVHRPSRTATHLPWVKSDGLDAEVRAGHVVVPMWSGQWTLPRLAAVLASNALTNRGRASLLPEPVSAEARQDEQWLVEHGVRGIVRMPIHTFGSTSSPERRAMAGSFVALGRSAAS